MVPRFFQGLRAPLCLLLGLFLMYFPEQQGSSESHRIRIAEEVRQ